MVTTAFKTKSYKRAPGNQLISTSARDLAYHCNSDNIIAITWAVGMSETVYFGNHHHASGMFRTGDQGTSLRQAEAVYSFFMELFDVSASVRSLERLHRLGL